MTETKITKDWRLFLGSGEFNQERAKQLKNIDPPPWRKFGDQEELNASQKAEMETRWKTLQQLAKTNEKNLKRGQSFRISTKAQDVIDAVNAAIYLRRPILVTGKPGSGKTSLAYAIAHELGLTRVLTWAINARTTLQNGLYRYDAIARLQDTNQGEKQDIGEYIKLGALGTAFLPSFLPRVLLIDEIDKCDLNLPNDLLNLFEEGEFEIEELVRRSSKPQVDSKQDSPASTETKTTFSIYTNDKSIKAEITEGRVSCYAFPIIVMTSNGERDFPPAFKRRCLRVRMPAPDRDVLQEIVKAHFGNGFFEDKQTEILQLIEYFKPDDTKSEERATDQLLNTIYLLTREVTSQGEEKESLKEMLCRRLNLPD
jgi:MoxR-like ATPase